MVRYKEKNRYAIDIHTNMLKVAKEGTIKTHFISRCNVNYRQLMRHLNELLGLNFIELDDSTGHEIYRTTTKGIDFLIAKEAIDRLMSPDNDLMPNGSNAPYR
jgi:predicted transcriptional regulator